MCGVQSKPAPVASAAAAAPQGGNGTTAFGRAASGALASSSQPGGGVPPASPQHYRSPVSIAVLWSLCVLVSCKLLRQDTE